MIGPLIRKLRKQQGLSLTKLAEKAGVSKSYVSYIEREEQQNPSLHFLTKIAEALDVPVDVFLFQEEKKEKKLDREWQELVQRAIDEGLSKEDFLQYQEFLKYANWKKETL